MKRSNGPQQLHNLSSSADINWSKYDSKYYLHFDDRVDIEHVKDQIQDPDWVSSHAFFPFIHFKIRFNKYVTLSKNKSLPLSNQKVKKSKVREIFYAAHKDRFIYKYYGDMLNNAYNDYAVDNKIDDIALAYRNNKKGKNNIDFAYEVFDFLLNQEQAIVISIDFKEFFDHIDHVTLKQNIKTVLGVKALPKDWYKVFKSITQFSYVNKTDTEEFLKRKYGIKKQKELLKTGKLKKIMNPSEFRAFKEELHLYKHKKIYGIPQGSGMSAVCSNVHLIHFDQEVKELIKKYQGLYRRYSDDMILVIPVTKTPTEVLTRFKNDLFQIIKRYESQGLNVQKEKTEIRLFTGGKILDENQKKSQLDYLGFVTDGKTVRMREKSLFKYYVRAYRKAETIQRIAFVTGRKGPRSELYDIYTHLGFNYKTRGNFTTYAYKAHHKFSKLKTKSLIRKQIKRHWNKIHQRLD